FPCCNRPSAIHPAMSLFRIDKGVIVMKASSSALSSRRRWSGRSASVAALAVVAASSALIAAGCGASSSGAGVAQIDTTKTATTGQNSGGSRKRDPAAYSACMRRNGVPNFPDPDSNGNIKITGGRDSHGGTFGIDANSPQFRKAQKACQKLQP